MSGKAPLSLGAVKGLREEAAAARGSLPQLDQAFRIVERLLEMRTSP